MLILRRLAHGLTARVVPQKKKKDFSVKHSTGGRCMVSTSFIVEQFGPGSQNRKPKAFDSIYGFDLMNP